MLWATNGKLITLLVTYHFANVPGTGRYQVGLIDRFVACAEDVY